MTLTGTLSPKKLRLGYFVPEFPSQTHIFFWREVTSLRELGVTVRLISTRKPSPQSCRHEFAPSATAETHYVFPPGWGQAVVFLLARPLRAIKALKYVCGLRESTLRERLRYLGFVLCASDLARHCAAERLSHIHAHSCADSAHIVALAHLLLPSVTYSLTLHGDLPVYGKDHLCKMHNASFVSAVTRALQTQILELTGFEPQRVPVIWMGVDTRRFVAKSLSASLAPLHLVTVARIATCKGHRFALEAMAKVLASGVLLRYTIAGSGPDLEEIVAHVTRLGLESHVHFAGSLAEAQVRELLEAADVFVLSSVGLGEAAPVSVMEAMACGLAVVCSIIGGTPDMISDEVDGLLVAQGDVEKLAQSFQRLALEPALRQRLGSAARAKATQRFDALGTAGALLAAIEQGSISHG